jgi:outer membrane protein OmpA-like peptidoglycan-associated protein
MRITTGIVASVLLAAVAVGAARAQESADHPLVGRYEGSEIEAHVTRAFDEYVLPVGALQDGEFAETLRVEGEVTWIGYRVPDGRSTLEVFRNYQEHLSGRGFEELFVCESIDACGYWFADRVFDTDPERYLHAADTGADEGVRYLAARRSGAGGEAYAQIVVYDDGNDVWTRVRVIEPEARETDMIVVEADEMAQAVSAEGRVVLQGVHFETDEATIRPESEPQLEALAEFLSDHPDTDVFVVGHTDTQGTLEHNLELSQRRAAAVVEALTSEYDVSPDRLEPRGVGPLAPAATNRTEEGRAMNRRVVLVER